MTNFLEIVSASPQETQDIGFKLGALAQPGDVLLLTGGLGVGKTCLTQGIAWGLGIQEYARSPSFVLVAEYRGRLTLYHMDLFRLERLEEVLDLGLDEYFYGKGLCVVEWAENAPQALPLEHLLVAMKRLADERRLLRLEPRGIRYQRLLEDLKAQGAPRRG